MDIFTFSIRRPITVTVITLALIVISLLFATRINIEDFPKMDIPVIAVTTIYRGAGPQEVEEQVSMKVEEAVSSIGNIQQVESYSQDSLSTVVVELQYGTDMESAAADIREKLDRIKMELPDGAEAPIVVKADPSDSPVVKLTLTSSTGDLRRLRSIADNEVKKELEKIGGIASINVNGGIERAMVVQVDPRRLEALSIPVSMVTSAVARENADIPVGHVTADDMEFSVRTIGQMKSPRDFENILITNVGGTSIFLKDVATIVDDQKEVRVMSRSNGEPSVTLDVKKNTDANVVVTADKVKEAVEKINKTLPAGYHLKVAYDKSKFIRISIENLEEIALEGALLAVVVILLFLRNFLSTIVICVSIPVSIVLTFLLIYFNKMTINMMTLLGFILAVGSIVDASVVVLENIFRHLEMGKDPESAAIDGAREVSGAVFGAVMTHAIVFVPIFLITGIPGQIFTPLAKTLISVMMASLAAAIFLVPMLSVRLLSKTAHAEHKGFAGWVDRVWNSFFEVGVRGSYRRIIEWCLNYRAVVVVLTIVVFGLSIWLSQHITQELQGKWDRGDFMINIETPVGSSLERTNRAVKEVEEYVLKNIPELETVVVDVGQYPSGVRGAMGSTGTAPRLGGMTVSLKEAEERKKHHQRDMYAVQDSIIDAFKDYPDAKVNVAEMFSISGKKPIEILVRGDNLDKLAEIAEGLKNQFEGIKGMKNIDLSYRPGSPEFRVVIDRTKAANLGISSGQVYSTLRTLLEEDPVSTYREGGNEYDIIVHMQQEERNSIEKIKQLRFVTPHGTQVALSEVADIIPEFGPSSITRRDRARYVSVQADLSGRALSEVLDEIQPLLKNLKLPTGYTVIIAGEEQERGEIFEQMFQVLFLGIILMYVFLAVQFESFIHPFTIMLAIPLELVGVFGALLLTGFTMTMFTLLGVIMLVGVVVTTSIVMIDYVLQRRELGMNAREAVLEAAPLRLRPILMTVSATLLAMVPLALGIRAGAAMFQGLAIASIGGLITSTFLTLIVVPVMYTIFEDISDRFFKKNRKNSKKEEVNIEGGVN